MLYLQLCTLEFESRRASYYWLLDSLDLFLPYVWEYARLNITNTVMSKRKVSKACDSFVVSLIFVVVSLPWLFL